MIFGLMVPSFLVLAQLVSIVAQLVRSKYPNLRIVFLNAAATKVRLSPNKPLFVSHVNFRQDLQKQLEVASTKEIALLFLNLDSAVQERIMRFIPNMERKSNRSDKRRND